VAGVFGRAAEFAAADAFIDSTGDRMGLLLLEGARGFHRLARGQVSVQSLRAGAASSRPATARIKAVKRKVTRRGGGRRRARGR
jgi:hypothetical protein